MILHHSNRESIRYGRMRRKGSQERISNASYLNWKSMKNNQGEASQPSWMEVQEGTTTRGSKEVTSGYCTIFKYEFNNQWSWQDVRLPGKDSLSYLEQSQVEARCIIRVGELNKKQFNKTCYCIIFGFQYSTAEGF